MRSRCIWQTIDRLRAAVERGLEARMVKKIGLGLVAIVVLFLIGGMVLPREVRVERSAYIDAPPSEVYALCSSFQNFIARMPCIIAISTDGACE